MRETTEAIKIGPPADTDGWSLNQLIASSPPLDTNSVYCNLLQCTHFSETSICAKADGKLVGFVSGYLIPDRPDTVFVWQVVVAESARGQGLAKRMLLALLERPACRKVQYVETTITPSNGASEALFRKLGEALDASIELSTGFDAVKHFNQEHETERLWRIGPIHVTK